MSCYWLVPTINGYGGYGGIQPLESPKIGWISETLEEQRRESQHHRALTVSMEILARPLRWQRREGFRREVFTVFFLLWRIFKPNGTFMVWLTERLLCCLLSFSKLIACAKCWVSSFLEHNYARSHILYLQSFLFVHCQWAELRSWFMVILDGFRGTTQV